MARWPPGKDVWVVLPESLSGACPALKSVQGDGEHLDRRIDAAFEDLF